MESLKGRELLLSVKEGEATAISARVKLDGGKRRPLIRMNLIEVCDKLLASVNDSLAHLPNDPLLPHSTVPLDDTLASIRPLGPSAWLQRYFYYYLIIIINAFSLISFFH